MVMSSRKTFTSFACSVIGAKHIKNGKPCQDFSLCEKHAKYNLIAVADGHGSDQYFRSDAGSRFAVEALRKCLLNPSVLQALLKSTQEKEREQIILQLKKSIVSEWNNLIAEHVKINPFTDDELNAIPAKYADDYRAGKHTESAYGSTLIAAIWTGVFFLALQIGDGTCVLLNTEAEFSQPVPADEKCFLNVTTSLCDKNVLEGFRHCFSNNFPVAVIIATDGIDDCFAGDQKLYDFYKVVLSSFGEKDEEAAKSELMDYLPRLSEKGSGDDVSIAMIINNEILRSLKIETGNI